jgi:hypothetical protein
LRHPESILQSKIVFALSAMGVFLFSVPNELMGGSKGAARKMAQFKAMGLRPGISDLILVSPSGRIHFLEIKTETGSLSPAQLRFQVLCHTYGWPYAVARSVEEATGQAKVWGLV